MLESHLNGLLLGHIDPSLLQGVDRVGASPAFKEIEVIELLLSPAIEHLLAQGYGSTDTCGILVDVEGGVEVWDPQAFQVTLFLKLD